MLKQNVSVILMVLSGLLVSCGQDFQFETQWFRHLVVRQADSSDIRKGLTQEGEYILALKDTSLLDLEESSEGVAFAVAQALSIETGSDRISQISEVKDDKTGQRYLTVGLTRVTSDELQGWKDLSLLHYAEPNWLSRPNANYEDYSLALSKISPVRRNYLTTIGYEGALKLIGNKVTDNDGPIVAVLDSGVDMEHPALAGKVFVNGNHWAQCNDDHDGCNVTNSTKRTFGEGGAFPYGLAEFGRSCHEAGRTLSRKEIGFCQHGTIISGIIAASPNGGEGLNMAPGICPGCRILNIKVLGDHGPSKGAISDEALMNALGYLVDLKKQGVPIKVVNASYGKYRMSRTVSLKIKELSKMGSGVLFVAAAGNENSKKPQYPAALDEVMGVANIRSGSGQKHESSNYGSWVDIAAPGSSELSGLGLCSSSPGGDIGCGQGTSFAAPVVAGVAGLVLSEKPDMTAGEVRNLLLKSSDVNMLLSGNRLLLSGGAGDPTQAIRGQLGAGVVSASRALSGNIADLAQLAEPQDRVGKGCGVVGSDGTLQLQWFWLVLPLFILFFSRTSSDA